MTGAPGRSATVATLKSKARALGFEVCGVTSANPPPDMRERLAPGSPTGRRATWGG
jgi:hypothetical protein